MENHIYYLASPYTHPDPAVEAFRFEAVCQLVADLMCKGYVVISPIAHSHPLAVRRPEVGGKWEVWQQLDTDLVRASEELWVFTLDGWECSKGVQAEIAIAESFGKLVRYVDREGSICG